MQLQLVAVSAADTTEAEGKQIGVVAEEEAVTVAVSAAATAESGDDNNWRCGRCSGNWWQ